MKKMILYGIGVAFISLTISMVVWHSHQQAYERGYRDGWKYNQQAIYERGFEEGREQGNIEGRQNVFDENEGIIIRKPTEEEIEHN